MEPHRRAIIDIGTNSIKLLVAEVLGQEVRPVCEESHQTRLGRGFYSSHRLQPGPITQSAEAVAGFVAKARQLRTESIRLIATSAARDAVNSGELVHALERAAGLPVEIISGEQEAEWAFRGVTTDPALAGDPLLILDVGGGSTEFILGHGKRLDFRRSVALGTVRLLEQIPHSNPPKPEELTQCRRHIKDFLQAKLSPELMPALRGETKYQRTGGSVRLVGTGGTASVLGCLEAELETFDRQRLEAVRLTKPRLTWHAERLWALPLTERQQLAGLPKNRADVILTGAAIFEAILQEFGFEALRISTRGLRFGALLD